MWKSGYKLAKSVTRVTQGCKLGDGFLGKFYGKKRADFL